MPEAKCVKLQNEISAGQGPSRSIDSTKASSLLFDEPSLPPSLSAFRRLYRDRYLIGRSLQRLDSTRRFIVRSHPLLERHSQVRQHVLPQKGGIVRSYVASKIA